MTEQTQKAIVTRTKRLSVQFKAEHGREPTIDELNALYSAEMKQAANKSSRNSAGTGGFALLKKQNPELLKEIQEKGRRNRVKKT